jgi:hypothetical protein
MIADDPTIAVLADVLPVNTDREWIVSDRLRKPVGGDSASFIAAPARWQGEGPRASLAKAFVASAPGSAVMTCEPFRSAVNARGLQVGSGEIGVSEDEVALPPAYMEMSAAVLNEAGDRALLYLGRVFGRLVGLGEMIHLSRSEDREWKIIGRSQLWVS